ncbi:MAG: hypothetical protein CMJ48_06905 [Planctomycetaceae bacterium]|nr:hypothetical protein [Planctomycetaceae bacterium]
MSSSPVERYRDFLREQGLRLTQERQLIVETVFELNPPFDGESVVQAVSYRWSAHRACRSTVYRTLFSLKEAGLLVSRLSADQRVVYMTTDHITPTDIAADLATICAVTHAKLISGTCPWCGKTILRGDVRDDPE